MVKFNLRCGLLPNFEAKLMEYYDAAELENVEEENRPFDRNCLSALTNYQTDLIDGEPEAVGMCDSWGAPFRYFGNPGNQDLKERA